MTVYFGKYRGQVVNNVDPMQKGRLQVQVPAVLGPGTLNWAMPCVPYAGPGVGFYFIPPVGANIWVEFEGGNPDYPIWSGCFWGDGEAPTPTMPTNQIIKTMGCTITISDSGMVTIQNLSGQKIELTVAGIDITSSGSAKVSITGMTVSINNGALEVT